MRGIKNSALAVHPLVKQGGRAVLCLTELVAVAIWGKARNRTAWLVMACAFPLGLFAQMTPRNGSPAPMDHWRWATTNQTVLRIAAMDARRQRVVVKVEGSDLTVLEVGAAVPGLAVALAAVSGNTAVFQPLPVSGKGSVERLDITLVDGSQVTTVARLATPPRSVASGWVVLPK